MKFVKWLLVFFILINILLVFTNVINPTWTVAHINQWIESPQSSGRLLNQDSIKNTPALSLGGEVRAVVENQTPQKN